MLMNLEKSESCRCRPGIGARHCLSAVLSVILISPLGSTVAADGAYEMNGGRFSPCPETPNCVSSRHPGTDHYIEPLRYHGDMAEAKAVLLGVLNELERVQIVENADGYIRAVFRSMLFRFADDVELQFDDVEKSIHIKSASRVGYSDLGVNRRRCESIRDKFNGSLGRH